MQALGIGLITFYQRWLSPWMGPACRFEPTCSQYAVDAIRHYGVPKGVGKACLRILKCHPFHPGGSDPVR